MATIFDPLITKALIPVVLKLILSLFITCLFMTVETRQG